MRSLAHEYVGRFGARAGPQVYQGPGRAPSHVLLRADRDSAFRKPARLGGYRHKVTGTLYLHAATQAAPPKPAARVTPPETRDAQTVDVATRSTQSVREFGTQMAAAGVLVSTAGDRIVTPRAYVSSVQLERRALPAAGCPAGTSGADA